MRKLLEEIRDALNDIEAMDEVGENGEEVGENGVEVCIYSDVERVKDLVHKMLMDVE